MQHGLMPQELSGKERQESFDGIAAEQSLVTHGRDGSFRDKLPQPAQEVQSLSRQPETASTTESVAYGGLRPMTSMAAPSLSDGPIQAKKVEQDENYAMDNILQQYRDRTDITQGIEASKGFRQVRGMKFAHVDYYDHKLPMGIAKMHKRTKDLQYQKSLGLLNTETGYQMLSDRLREAEESHNGDANDLQSIMNTYQTQFGEMPEADGFFNHTQVDRPMKYKLNKGHIRAYLGKRRGE